MLLEILNIKNLRANSRDELLAFCDHKLQSGEGATLVPINPIKVIKARKYAEFQQMIDNADWVFPDAWGIKWAARVLHGQIIELLPGWTVMLDLIKQAEGTGRSVYLLGTKTEILEKACVELQRRHPNLRIVGSHHGFFDPYNAEQVYQQIIDAAPDYVFVAMGEKKQEEVIERLRPRHRAAIYLGVGGSIDLLTGDQPMPPAWIRSNHLEWLYRAVRQPFRLPRFLALPVFVALIATRRLASFS